MNVKALLHKPDVDASLDQLEDELTQVVEVAGQPVHGVTDNGVPFADEAQHRIQLRSVRVFTGSLVREQLVRFETVELPEISLVEGAHALIPNHQSLSRGRRAGLCSDRFFSFRHQVLD